jgi:hypothetical protein
VLVEALCQPAAKEKAARRRLPQTGYRSGQEDQGYGNTVYDAQQQALADILGYRQNETATENQFNQNTINALQQAYQNSLAYPERYGYGDTSAGASTVPTSTDALTAALRRFNTAQRSRRPHPVIVCSELAAT